MRLKAKIVSTTPAPIVRLSVIVPVRNSALDLPIPDFLPKKALVERTVQSILDQDDPVGVEVVVACGGNPAAVADHLETIYPSQILTNRVQVGRFPRVTDPAVLKNQAAHVARGHFLSFIEPGDWWRPSRLSKLEPWLPGSDLLVSTRDDLRVSTDWLRSFLSENWAVRSSMVVRRHLFDKVGGFPEGCSGSWFPRRLPGSDSYEFFLRALVQLTEDDAQDRFTLLGSEEIVIEAGWPGGALPGPLASLEKRARQVREKASLLHLLRNLPGRHRPLALRALLGTKKISG